MAEFYVQNGNGQATVVDSGNFDEALWDAMFGTGDKFHKPPIYVTDRITGIRKIVISFCPECSVHVFSSDEWMLTDVAGVYQHVECDRTDRFVAMTKRI